MMHRFCMRSQSIWRSFARNTIPTPVPTISVLGAKLELSSTTSNSTILTVSLIWMARLTLSQLTGIRVPKFQITKENTNSQGRLLPSLSKIAQNSAQQSLDPSD